MKVLYLTNLPTPYRVDFFNALGDLCDLTVIYERDSASDRDPRWDRHQSRSFREIYLHGIRIPPDSSLSLGITRYLDRRFDTTVVGGYSTPTAMCAIEYLKHKRIPFLLNADGGFVRSESDWKRAWKHHFISAASAWITTGRASIDYLVNYGAIRDRVFLYPFAAQHRDSPYDQNPDAIREQSRRRLGISERRVIISVGQFIPRKGFDVLLRAAANLQSDTGIYLIGGHPTEEYISLQRQVPDAHVHFVDFKPQDQLSLYYQAADVFVLPTREDIWGLVVNEALSFGLPVISTDRCNAALEMITPEQNGLIIPANNPQALSMAIHHLLTDLDPDALRRSSLQLAQQYSIDNMARRHIEIFQITRRLSNES